MEHSYISALLLAAAGAVLAQNKSSTPAACNADFYPGTNTVLDTVPYPYPQVPSIIGNFRDITRNSIPSDAVSLDGNDSTIGTQARRQPVRRDGRCQPFNRGNTTIYSDLNSTVATPVCGGAACALNLTADICATDFTRGAVFS